MKRLSYLISGLFYLVGAVALCACGRNDYYTAIDNQGRYRTERQAQIIKARLEMFNKAMETAGKTTTPLDDLLVYITYDKGMVSSSNRSRQPVLTPPPDPPEYIRAVGSVVVPFLPWHYTAKMVEAGYGVLKQAMGPRYATGGGALNIYDSYNDQTLSSGRDGSLTGPSRVLTDSHDDRHDMAQLPESQSDSGGEMK